MSFRSLKSLSIPAFNIIPDWVTIIEHGAFEGCASLESIILPVGEALVAFSLKAALL